MYYPRSAMYFGNQLFHLSVRALVQHLHRDLDQVCEGEEQVHVVVDCCSSRSTPDRMFAFDRMKVRWCHYDDNEGDVVPL